MGKVAVAIELDDVERAELERLKRGRKVLAGLLRRAATRWSGKRPQVRVLLLEKGLT